MLYHITYLLVAGEKATQGENMMPGGRADASSTSGTSVQLVRSVEKAALTVWLRLKPQAPTSREAQPLGCSTQPP